MTSLAMDVLTMSTESRERNSREEERHEWGMVNMYGWGYQGAERRDNPKEEGVKSHINAYYPTTQL